MHKSSIYLPDDLKRSLTRQAAVSGRSEAELIRRAIEQLLGSAAGAEAGTATGGAVDVAAPELAGPMLVGVGVGPGDASLVTARAVAALRSADRVLVATTDARSISRAEAVVRVVAPLAPIERVAFEITAAPARAASMDRMVDAALGAIGAGELVAVAVLGDPAQWTVFPQLAARVRTLRPAVAVTAVPGVTAYQAVAAAEVLVLGEGAGAFVVTADPQRARRAIDEGEAVVLHKATTDGETVRRMVLDTGRDDAVLAELTGLPAGRNRNAAETPDGPLAYLSSVIVPQRPAARAAR